MASTAARLARSEFLLLTTYRKDGRPVPTTVWVVPLDDEIGVWTVDGSAKVRRIRAQPRVTLSECDRVGTPLGPAPVEGRARILDSVGTARVRAALQTKYNLAGPQLDRMLQQLGPGRQAVGLAVTTC
jgi:PPOX class probable F420-dependent enzyme